MQCFKSLFIRQSHDVTSLLHQSIGWKTHSSHQHDRHSVFNEMLLIVRNPRTSSYRLGMVNSKTVNPKFHLNQTFYLSLLFHV